MAGRKPGTPKTGGRKKGTPNKTTGAIKDMIVQALSEAGGVGYLLKQAKENPTAFMGLVGKVLPLQLTGEDGAPIRYENVKADADAITSFVAGLASRSGEEGRALETKH